MRDGSTSSDDLRRRRPRADGHGGEADSFDGNDGDATMIDTYGSSGQPTFDDGETRCAQSTDDDRVSVVSSLAER